MYEKESDRKYRTVFSLSKNIKVINLKKHGSHDKMPRTSHTANRVYVTMRADGSDVADIARYDKNHQKRWSIHTAVHKERKEYWRGGHVHYWKNGKPNGRPQKLSDHPQLQRLLEEIRKMKKL